MEQDNGGRDTDGEDTLGMVEETSRPAQAGETGTTRFGMEEGADTDGAGSGGMVQKDHVTGGSDAGADTDGAGSGGMVQDSSSGDWNDA